MVIPRFTPFFIFRPKNAFISMCSRSLFLLAWAIDIHFFSIQLLVGCNPERGMVFKVAVTEGLQDINSMYTTQENPLR